MARQKIGNNDLCKIALAYARVQLGALQQNQRINKRRYYTIATGERVYLSPDGCKTYTAHCGHCAELKYLEDKFHDYKHLVGVEGIQNFSDERLCRWAKSIGVSWKECPDNKINKMRLMMALKKHFGIN